MPPESLIYTGEVPKELMDAYQQMVGDGNAGVSVSTDMGVKNFGSGVSAMVTVSLSCNQDQTTLQNALEMAAQMGRWYANKFRDEAEQSLKQNLESQGRRLET